MTGRPTDSRWIARVARLALLSAAACAASSGLAVGPAPAQPTGVRQAVAPQPLPESPAAPAIPPGTGRLVLQAAGLPVTVHTYRPADTAPRGPLLLVLHDEGGSAERYRDLARPIARAHGYTIAVPQLDGERFAGWRLAWAGIARRTFPDNGVVVTVEPATLRLDAVLSALVAQLRSDGGGAPVPHALLGHGAGAEALLRWSAFATTEAMHIVAANPRTTLMPSRSLDFPWGFGQLPGAMASERVIRAFLAQPLTVVSGSSPADLGREGPAGDSLLARGRNFISAGRQAALDMGRPVYWRQVEVSGAGDDVGRLFAASALLQALQPFVGDE